MSNHGLILLSGQEFTEEIIEKILEDASKPLSNIKLYVWDQEKIFYPLLHHVIDEIRSNHPSKVEIFLPPSDSDEDPRFLPCFLDVNYRFLWIKKIQAEQYVGKYPENDKAKIKKLQNEKGASLKKYKTGAEGMYGLMTLLNTGTSEDQKGAPPSMHDIEARLSSIGVYITHETLDKFFYEGLEINKKKESQIN